MSLLAQIDEDLNQALKEGDQIKLSVLRLVKSALKNQQIAQQSELDDEAVLKILRREANNRKEAIGTYKQGGRPELADKEAEELAVIEAYLPAPLSDEELARLVEDTVAELKASTMADMGKVMGAVHAKVDGRAEGAKLAELVKKHLSS